MCCFNIQFRLTIYNENNQSIIQMATMVLCLLGFKYQVLSSKVLDYHQYLSLHAEFSWTKIWS